jgi:hypothetical protein
MAIMRFFFFETTQKSPQDFKLLVSRSTVASVKKKRSAYAICMLNILQGARENAEVLQMIYLEFICNTSTFFLAPCKIFNMQMAYADRRIDYKFKILRVSFW